MGNSIEVTIFKLLQNLYCVTSQAPLLVQKYHIIILQGIGIGDRNRNNGKFDKYMRNYYDITCINNYCFIKPFLSVDKEYFVCLFFYLGGGSR